MRASRTTLLRAALASALALVGAAALAKSTAPAPATRPAAADVCGYTSRGWSEARSVLEQIVRFRGPDPTGLRRIAKEALAGSERGSIGDFSLRYKRGRSGMPPPNEHVCYAYEATFFAGWNGGVDADGLEDQAGYACTVSLDVKGKVGALHCELVAG